MPENNNPYIKDKDLRFNLKSLSDAYNEKEKEIKFLKKIILYLMRNYNDKV